MLFWQSRGGGGDSGGAGAAIVVLMVSAAFVSAFVVESAARFVLLQSRLVFFDCYQNEKSILTMIPQSRSKT